MGDSKTYPAFLVCAYMNDWKLKEISRHINARNRRWYDVCLGNNKTIIFNKSQVKIAKQDETCCLLQSKHAHAE